jgi:hypothetical protein
VTNSGTVTNQGVINGTGTYTQTSGQTSSNGTMTQNLVDIKGGTLSGSGTINGEVNIAGGGVVSPGNSPGTLTINGPFSSSGTLLIEIAGLGAGKFDVLDINGAANFAGGDINFEFIDGYKPLKGDFWDFLFANSITGWETLLFSLLGLGSGYEWQVVSNTGFERLLITEAPSAAPLPPAILLMGSGLLILIGLRRFEKN